MHKAKSSRVKAMIYMDAFSQRLPYPTLRNYRTNRHKSARTLKKKMNSPLFPSSPENAHCNRPHPGPQRSPQNWIIRESNERLLVGRKGKALKYT